MSKKVDPNIEQLAQSLQRRGWMVGTAESCTGGLVSAALTDVAGSSAWFSHTVVAYSYAAKTSLLGVPESLLEETGAVSEAVARAMVEGMLRQKINVAVSVTGIAGPGGGSVDKPVGTVWMACGGGDGVCAHRYVFNGSRAEVREQAVGAAIQLLRDYCSQ